MALDIPQQITPQMTAQQIFDYVTWFLLVKQGRPSYHLGYMKCLYRLERQNEPTLMCAVGCLIPDKLYRKTFEDKTVDKLIYSHLHAASKYPGLVSRPKQQFWLLLHRHEKLLSQLQHAHDWHSIGNKDFVPLFLGEAKKIAKEFGLRFDTNNYR